MADSAPNAPQYPPPPGTKIRVSYGDVTPWSASFNPGRVVHKRFEVWIDPATGKQAGRWTWQEGWPPAGAA